MRFPISRSGFLTGLVVVALVAAIPFALLELTRTGKFYIVSHRFAEDMVARLRGPGRLRFIFQPSIAILLGVRDGTQDARRGATPFLWDLLFHSANRRNLVRSSFASVRDLVAVAILLDMAAQLLILRMINPFAAILLGPTLIALPYASARALTNRLASRRKSQAPLSGTQVLHDE